jgi:hypothetical protein
MIEEVKNSLKELKTRFPTYHGQGYELSGFVWFQGWNDMYHGFQDEYAENMKNFIKDVRKDLGEPDLPFVIGMMGQNGFKEAKGNMAIVKAAQASMNEVPEFAGLVRSIPTDIYWDKKADEAYPSWRKNFEEWKKIGSDHPYHYLGSTLFFSRVGRAFGETLINSRSAYPSWLATFVLARPLSPTFYGLLGKTLNSTSVAMVRKMLGRRIWTVWPRRGSVIPRYFPHPRSVHQAEVPSLWVCIRPLLTRTTCVPIGKTIIGYRKESDRSLTA